MKYSLFYSVTKIIMVGFVSVTLSFATLIDFETMYDGSIPVSFSSSAETEFSALGVTFAGGGTSGQPKFQKYSSLSGTIANHPTDNDWFITTSSRTGGGSHFDLDIMFSDLVYEVSGDVVVNPGYDVLVSIYDASDMLLGSMMVQGGSPDWIAGSFNTSTVSPIARINLLPSSPAAGAGLDNLRFGPQTVPEPSTFPLISFGIIVFIGWRRRSSLNRYLFCK